jgi:hypothetical protein
VDKIAIRALIERHTAERDRCRAELASYEAGANNLISNWPCGDTIRAEIAAWEDSINTAVGILNA